MSTNPKRKLPTGNISLFIHHHFPCGRELAGCYAVEVDSATVVYINPKEYTGKTNLVKQSLFSEYNWTIKLKVDQNKYRDHYNFAGTKNNALAGIDR